MKRFSNILFVAGSGQNESTAFKQAVNIAEINQAKLTVVGVFDDISRLKSSMPIASDLIDGIIEQKKQELQNLVNSVLDHDLQIEVKVFTGKAFINIIQEVIKFERDLLIKAIEQPIGFIETLFANTDIKILRKCPCPVWLIKTKAQEGYKEILVGIDYEPDNPENDIINQQMLTMAGSLALADFSELHIVHAWQLPHEAVLRSYRSTFTTSQVDEMVEEEKLARKKWFANTVKRSMDTLGNDASSFLKPVMHLVEGCAGEVVPELAKEIGVELVVLSTLGRSGVTGYLIGNTAETILNQIDCSVLAIKPPGFISPVKLDKE